MTCRRCAACGAAFRPRPQVPQQRYCDQTVCQKERRRRWQQAKRQGDGDYRANQAQAQRVWAAGHQDYWRAWRAAHPAYVEGNRTAQRERDRRRHASRLAKMDASPPVSAVSSGTYRLVPWTGTDLAKMAVYTVELTVISAGYRQAGGRRADLAKDDVIGAAGAAC